MPRQCTICEHEQRSVIEADLAAGVPFRSVSARYGTSTGALQRHKAHLKQGGAGGNPPDFGLPSLEPREEKLAALLAQGNITVSEACRQCGFNPTSTSIRKRLKPGGDIRQRVVAQMREYGLTLDVALLKIRELLDGKKEIVNPAASRPGAALAAVAAGTPLSPTIEVRDNETQRWAVEQTLKLHDAYPEKGDRGQSQAPVEVETLFTDVTLPDGRVGRHMRVRIGQKEIEHDA